MDDKSIDEKIDLICKNLNCFGLKRYDPRDIDDFVNKINNRLFKKIISIVLQLGEVINPFIVRKLIGAEKRLYPTTYTFLIESQFLVSNSLSIQSDVKLMEECVDSYYSTDGHWKAKENTSFFPVECNKKPSMPLYMLCRCNNLLARLGNANDREEWIHISQKTARYVLENHIVSQYDDGTESVSYYYNSDEFTINVNAELIDWLTMLTKITNQKTYVEHINRILIAILNEQNQDGSWDYYSKYTMKRNGLKETVDCHHSATTIYNLVHVYENAYFLDDKLRIRLKKGIIWGMSFFATHFFDNHSGNGIVIIGKRRKASTVQFAESLVSLIEYIRVMKDVTDVENYKTLADLLCNKLLILIKKDGSAPGDMKIKRINLNNINWGNGVALYALCTYKKNRDILCQNMQSGEAVCINKVDLRR